MNKITKQSLIALVVAFAISACSEEYVKLSSSDFGVKFQTSSGAVTEGPATKTYKIPVNLAGTARSSAVDIAYTLSGTAVEGTDYTFISTKGKVTIPANQYTDTVKLSILNDFQFEPTKTLILTLTTSSASDVKAGVGGTLGTIFTLTLSDDDCAYVETDLIGTKEGKEIYGPGSCYPEPATATDVACTLYYGVEITKIGTNQFNVFNYWDSGYNLKFTVNTSNFTVTVPVQTVNASGSRSAVGSGTLSTCNRTVTVRTTLYTTSTGAVLSVFDNEYRY